MGQQGLSSGCGARGLQAARSPVAVRGRRQGGGNVRAGVIVGDAAGGQGPVPSNRCGSGLSGPRVFAMSPRPAPPWPKRAPVRELRGWPARPLRFGHDPGRQGPLRNLEPRGHRRDSISPPCARTIPMARIVDTEPLRPIRRAAGARRRERARDPRPVVGRRRLRLRSLPDTRRRGPACGRRPRDRLPGSPPAASGCPGVSRTALYSFMSTRGLRPRISTRMLSVPSVPLLRSVPPAASYPSFSAS